MSAEVTSAPVRAGLLVDIDEVGPGDAARLQASRCDECGRMEFPGRAECPWCGGSSSFVAIGPEATLAGFTAVLHPAPGSMIEPPYDIGVARFTNGLEIMGLLVAAGDDHAVGDPVEVCVVKMPDGRLTYGFRSA